MIEKFSSYIKENSVYNDYDDDDDILNHIKISHPIIYNDYLKNKEANLKYDNTF